MGQNNSVPQPGRQPASPTRQSSPQPQGTTFDSTSHPLPSSREEWPLTSGTVDHTHETSHSGRDTIEPENQPPVHHTDDGGNVLRYPERASAGQDTTAFESEERPLVGDDLHPLENPISSVNASPLSRRRSVMSRVGARVRQRYSLLSQTNEEAPAAVQGTSQLGVSSFPERVSEGRFGTVRRRISTLGHLPRISSRASGRQTSRARFAPISRPILQYDDSELNPYFGVADASRRAPTPSPALTSSRQEDEAPQPTSMRWQSRLSRVRQSISVPIGALFRGSFHEASNDYQTPASTHRSLRSREADDSDYLIPPDDSQDINADPDEHLSQASDSTGRTPLESLDALLGRHTHNLPTTQEQTQQASSIGQEGREGRRLPNLLRGRSSRIIRRDDQTPLARILQVAAAAIAAQLSGTTDALSNLEAMGEDHFDGGLNAFVEELNNVTGQPNRNDNDGSSLNFWRVFRFANNQEMASEDVEQDQQTAANTPRPTGDRTVTVVVVGVRSVPSSSLAQGAGPSNQNLGAGLDALLSLPGGPRTTRGGPSSGIGSGLLRSVAGRSRLNRPRGSAAPSSPGHTLPLFSHRNIASNSNFNSLNPQPLLPNHFGTSGPLSQRRPSSSHIPTPLDSSRLSESNIPSSQDLSQLQTLEPADMGNVLSRLRNNRRGSANDTQPASEGHATAGQNESTGLHRGLDSPAESDLLTTPNAAADAAPINGLRYRRRSDSEAHRHRQNGARDSRRNGIVAPEGRSWLIYVVGTNLSANHPALATPTIFTDVS